MLLFFVCQVHRYNKEGGDHSGTHRSAHVIVILIKKLWITFKLLAEPASLVAFPLYLYFIFQSPSTKCASLPDKSMFIKALEGCRSLKRLQVLFIAHEGC